MKAKSKVEQVDDGLDESKSDKCETEEYLWDEIGFHRPLGGLLYNLTLIVLTILFGVVINLYILPKFVYPFPETLGWQDMTNQLFYLTFVIADLGIGAALQRFIGEISIKNVESGLIIQFGQGQFSKGTLKHWHFDIFRISWDFNLLSPQFITFITNSEGDIVGLKIENIGEFSRVFSQIE